VAAISTKLCEHLYLRREYVEGRLLLLRAMSACCNPVREKRISLAVAKELNKVADVGLRRSFSRRRGSRRPQTSQARDAWRCKQSRWRIQA